MARELSPEMVSAIAANTIVPAILVKLEMDTGDACFWSGQGAFSWGGDTFSGVGELGAISDIEETKSISANGVTLKLSGIPQDIISMSLAEKYRGRKGRVWVALFNPATNRLLDSPYQIFAGRIDAMTVTDSGDTSTIDVPLESHLISMNRPNEKRYTDQEQKQMFPGDRGLEYVAALQGAEFTWGKDGSGVKLNGGGVGGFEGRRPYTVSIT